MQVHHIDISKVRQFSDRDREYLLNSQKFSKFLGYDDLSLKGFESIIKQRSSFKTDRDTLTQVISEQYANTPSSSRTQAHISDLRSDNCFTLTTAHQPSLLTGPLYYIFKILSVIKLASALKQEYPTYNFAPVFVIGSEDHDFDEINHLYLFGKKKTWESSQKGGPVGKYPLDGLSQIIDEVASILGEHSKAKDLLTQLKKELLTISDYGAFSFKLTHILFDHLGLVILRMDDAKLKTLLSPITKSEITEQPSQQLVQHAQQQIEEELGYKSQAFARKINFFYNKDGLRERIVQEGDQFQVNNTAIEFSVSELEAEIDQHPERFSPNVVMRPIYQSLILPDLAYVGGGGELAYWMERKTQFEHYNVHFPLLVRRTSGMIITPSANKQVEKLGLNLEDLFMDHQSLISHFLTLSGSPDHELGSFEKQIEDLFQKLEEKVTAIDHSLKGSVGAEKAKAQKGLSNISGKLKKAIKAKEEVNLTRIQKLQDQLFPKGLQERHDNIFQYISTYGVELIDELLDHCDPLSKTFRVFFMQP